MTASWIWTPDSDELPNRIVRFRRVFSLDKPINTDLLICADSCYVLYVNGRRVGEGPPKSFPWRRFFDRYTVSPWLTSGVNCIGILVISHGINSGRSFCGPGGLWVRLESEEGPILATDTKWLVARAPFKMRAVRRMAYGTEYCDVHDMREEDGWLLPGYTAALDEWSTAVESAVEQDGPSRLEAGPVSPLTRDIQHPRSISDLRSVVVPGCRVALDLVEALRHAGIDDSETGPIGGYLVTSLHAEADTVVTMERMNPTFDLDTFGCMKVNNREVEFDAYGVGEFPASMGANLLVVKVERAGQSHPSWVFSAPTELSLRAPVDLSPRAPESSTGNPVQVLLAAEPLHPAFYDEATPEHFAGIADQFDAPAPVPDPFAETWSAVDVTAEHGAPRLSNGDALLNDGPHAATLTPAALKPAVTLTPAAAAAQAAKASPVAETAPARATATEFLLDFGEETMGYVGFDVEGSAGTVVDLVGFEAMLHGERVRTDNLNNSVRVTLRDGRNEYLSTVRMGFRYLVVTVRRGPVRIRSIFVMRAVHPVEHRGSFRCSDPLLERAWEMGRRTVELCMDDTFVDCPAYEASFWVGDMRTAALTALAAFGETDLTGHSLRLAAESLEVSPFVQALVPSRRARVIPNWSLLWTVSVWEHFLYSGDEEELAGLLPAITRQAESICDHIEENGLFRYTDWNMMDWAEMDLPPNCFPAVESGWAAHALDLSRKAADSVGSQPGADNERWRRGSETLRTAINDLLWSDDERGYRDSLHADGTPGTGFSQQTQIVLLLADCVPEERLPMVTNTITGSPEGWTCVASPWMMWFRLEALAKLGRHDTVLQTLREYWGVMVRDGATTCWETFSNYFEGRWSPTRSWCHGWSSAPTWFLSRFQLGVSWTDPGAREVVVEPVPGDLAWAEGRVPTPRGDIEISWSHDTRRFNLHVVAPEGIKVTARVPEGYEPGDVRVENRGH